MRIQKSVFPKDKLSQNEWFETFNVSTRRDKFKDFNQSRDINSEYNFSNFRFLSTEESYFSKILKYFKFINI